MSTLTVCYFGAYDRSYSRNKVLISGLRKNGVVVIECHNQHPFKVLRLPLLAAKYLRQARHANVIVVGSSGHTYVPLAKLLGKITGKPVILDAFVSQYGTVVEDRKETPPDSWRAMYFCALDKVSTRLADVVLMDTDEHVEYYHRAVDASRTKFRHVLVGADTELFFPRPRNKNSDFIVTFVGTFIPLHGVEYILKAAKELCAVEDVRFQLVGSGQTYVEARRLAAELNLTNLSFMDPVAVDQLPGILAQADVCLGIFGGTEKASRVVPNKVYEAMAMGKPVITGDTPAIRPLLTHLKNAYLVPVANSHALANAILQLKSDSDLRERMAGNARETFLNMGTPEVIGRELAWICEEVVARNAAAPTARR